MNVTKIKKPKFVKTPRDHDYAFSRKLLDRAYQKIQKLQESNRLLRKTAKKQSSIIKCKNRSVNVWKQKFKSLKKSTTAKKPKAAEGLLSELVRNAGRTAKGVRYSVETKNLALCLFYCSTRTYKELRRHLKLPSPGLIKKWIRSLKITDGLCTSVLHLLKEKSKPLSKKDRVVSIAIDEMSLKPHLSYYAKAKPDEIVGFPSKLPGQEVRKTSCRASSALVIMIKFLSTGYKQSIGYFF